MNLNDARAQGSADKAPKPAPPTGSGVDQDQTDVIKELRGRMDDLARSRDTEIVTVVRAQRYLQRLLFGTLLAAILMALGTSLFFIKQMKFVRQQLEAQRSSTDSLRDFTGRVEPEIHRFAGELQTFSATNPDFRPVLEEFQPRLPRYFSTFVPSSSNPYSPTMDPQAGSP